MGVSYERSTPVTLVHLEGQCSTLGTVVVCVFTVFNTVRKQPCDVIGGRGLHRFLVSQSLAGGEPQKALRGVIPASLCLVLGGILWDFFCQKLTNLIGINF